MKYNEVAPIPKQMTIVVGLCVVGLMAFGLALSYYKNVLFDKQLETMQERNARLKQEISASYAELQYLQSDQFKDKYAKENFGLLHAGEKMIIINKPPENVIVQNSVELTPEEKQAVLEQNLRSIRIIDHWKMYLFNRGRIEEFKKSI